MISVKCPSCSKAYNVDDKFAGKKAKCKECGAVMSIPESAPAPEPLADASALAELEAAAQQAPRAEPTPTRAPATTKEHRPAQAAATPRPAFAGGQYEPGFNGEARGEPAAMMVLLLAILSLFLPLIGFITGLIALVWGLAVLKKIDASGGALLGRGKAQVGAILGGIALGLQLLLVPAALLIGIMLPALGAARRTANQMKNSSQLRGIHQAMVIYAQSNNSYFPGLNGDGEIINPTAEGRLDVVLRAQYFGPELLVNPQDASTITPYSPNAPLAASMHSYALLEIINGHGRLAEWKDNANSQAILITDRNTGTNAKSAQSVWTSRPGDWRGSTVWGDNHASFEQSPAGFVTRYDSNINRSDNIFIDEGGDDALMVR